MKNLIKLALILCIALFIFACDDTTSDSEDKSAELEITNLSNNPADVWIYASGSSNQISLTLQANSTSSITIEDGEAGINVDGGVAVIEFAHTINGEQVDVTTLAYADLSTSLAAMVTIDNPYGCLDIESYSQNAEMWVSIDGGSNDYIPIYGDVTYFFDPFFGSTVVNVDYNGHTVFAGSTVMTVTEDDYSRLDIYPDAGCIWIENNSSTFYIEEVYVSLSSSWSWGSNMLYSDIAPGESFSVTVTPGTSWDLKVVDNYDDPFTDMSINVSVDEIHYHDYTGFRAAKNDNADQDKIDNAANAEIPVGNPICQPNSIFNQTTGEISLN